MPRRIGSACRSASRRQAYPQPADLGRLGFLHIEDYCRAGRPRFQTHATSLIVEGVFARHPNLKMVMLESGFTWLPAYLWRAAQVLARRSDGNARGRPRAAEIVRSNIRFLAAAGRCAAGSATLNRSVDHMQSDELLYSRPTIRTGNSTATRCCRGDFAGSCPQDHDR
jgi:predicted TIM-barrel fold metal-dependent hydrolase